MSVMKTCKRCKRSLPMTKKYFNENVSSRDGFQSYCRSCQKKQNIADAMKLMRRGGPKTKIRKPRMPKIDPNPAADKFKNRVNK